MAAASAAQGDSYAAASIISASNGEAMRHLASAGAGIVCLACFVTDSDRARGDLMRLLTRDTVELRQAVSAMYYRNTTLPSLIMAVLDLMAGRLG